MKKCVKIAVLLVLISIFSVSVGVYIYNKPFVELGQLMNDRLKDEHMTYKKENNLDGKIVTMSMVIEEHHFDCVSKHLKLLMNRDDAIILLDAYKYRKTAMVFDIWVQFTDTHREMISILGLLCKADVSVEKRSE